MMVTGSTAWMNPYGYLPGQVYGYLPFYGTLFVCYCLFSALYAGVLWSVEIMKSMHPLKAEITDGPKYKPYDKLKEKLDRVLGLNSEGATTVRRETRAEKDVRVQEEEIEDSSPLPDDDDDNAFFDSLAKKK